LRSNILANLKSVLSSPRQCNYADLQNLTSVVQVNCSQSMCALDGVTMMGAAPFGGGWNTFHIGHAVRVFDGLVRSITVLDSQHTGGLAVVDAKGKPFGSFMSKSAGGLVLVSEDVASPDATMLPSVVSPNAGMKNLRGSSHAMLFGLSGEMEGRMAIEARQRCFPRGNFYQSHILYRRHRLQQQTCLRHKSRTSPQPARLRPRRS